MSIVKNLTLENILLFQRVLQECDGELDFPLIFFISHNVEAAKHFVTTKENFWKYFEFYEFRCAIGSNFEIMKHYMETFGLRSRVDRIAHYACETGDIPFIKYMLEGMEPVRKFSFLATSDCCKYPELLTEIWNQIPADDLKIYGSTFMTAAIKRDDMVLFQFLTSRDVPHFDLIASGAAQDAPKILQSIIDDGVYDISTYRDGILNLALSRSNKELFRIAVQGSNYSVQMLTDAIINHKAINCYDVLCDYATSQGFNTDGFIQALWNKISLSESVIYNRNNIMNVVKKYIATQRIADPKCVGRILIYLFEERCSALTLDTKTVTSQLESNIQKILATCKSSSLCEIAAKTYWQNPAKNLCWNLLPLDVIRYLQRAMMNSAF